MKNAAKNDEYETVKFKRGIIDRLWVRLDEDEKQDLISAELFLGILILFIGGCIGMVFGLALGEQSGINSQARASCTNLCEFHSYDTGLIKGDSCICLHPMYPGGSGVYEIKHFK